jgi:Gluconate 2-dehydrogenase subunit 3
MNRRTVIRNVVIVSAGTVLLPACVQKDKSSITLKNISLSGSQEEMLAELTETIIPKTKDFIGAKDLKAHEFVLTMVDDCTDPESQRKFSAGMKQFEDVCREKWKTSFIKTTIQQKKELLQQMEKKENVPEDALHFYGTVKRYTVQSFTSSQPFLVDVRKYQMVPGGNFKGCVPVKKA